jgi:hypothetical protein
MESSTTSEGAVIHGALAVGAAAMSRAGFDFRTPRWVTAADSTRMAVLAGIFLLQGLSDLTGDRSLEAYAWALAGQGTSLDAQAPLLKALWLTPFVCLLFESVRKPSPPR